MGWDGMNRRGDRRREFQDKIRQDKTRQDKVKQALLSLSFSLVFLFLSISISIHDHLTPNPPKVSFSTWFDRRRRGAGEVGLVGLGWVR